MVRTLDRYVVREIVSPVALALLVFTFILMTPPIARTSQDLLAKGVPVAVIARLLLLVVPQTLALTIPMAFLLGVLVAFGRLSGDSEWVAMQACGVGLYRMLRPVLLAALVAWGVTQWVTLYAIPWCSQSARELQFNVVATSTEAEIKPRVFFRGFPGLVLCVRDVRPGRGGWNDVFVADTSRPGQPVIYLARHGRLLVERARHQVQLVLEEGTQHSVTADARGATKYDVNRFTSMVISQDPAKLFRDDPAKSEPEMTVAELRAHAAERVKAGLSPHNAIWYLHQKFSFPVACFVFAAIGLGFGVSGARSGKLAAFALGLGVIFAYYILLYLTMSLVKGLVVAAWLGPWIPNILIALVGVALVRAKGRRGDSALRWQVPRRLGAMVARWRQARPARGRGEGRPLGARVLAVLARLTHPRLRPLLIDRYIAATYFRLLGLTLVALLGLFYISSFLDQSEKLFKGHATVGMVLLFLWYSTPQFVYFVVPVAVLLSTLITIGLLTRNSELVVLKACGVSLYRVALPLVAFAALASLLLFAVQEQVMAAANGQAEDLRQRIRHGAPRVVDRFNHRWLAGKHGEIYHYELFDPRGGVLSALSVFEFDETRWLLRRRTFASGATYRGGPGQENRWDLRGGWVRELDPQSDALTNRPFVFAEADLEPPEYFGSEQPEADRMTFGELNQYIGQMESAGMNVVPYLVSLHQKISFPFATIVVTLLAIPFAVTTGRRGALYGLGVGIALAMIYWTANNVFGAVGSAGLIAPMLAAWAPNILFGAGAACLILTVNT